MNSSRTTTILFLFILIAKIADAKLNSQIIKFLYNIFIKKNIQLN